MDLHQYLSLPDAFSIREVSDKLDGAPSDSLTRLVRQWRAWYEKGRHYLPGDNSMRQPSPQRCVELSKIDKRMTLQALRPDDWFRIWPTLPGAAKARKQAAQEAAHA